MSVNTYINGQLHRVGGIAYYKAGQSIQVNEMPEASASLINRVYQYIGATNENYTHGFFYECVLENDTYSWQILDTNPALDNISNSNLANMWASGGGSSVNVEPLTANSNGIYNAPSGTAYNPVTVDIEMDTLNAPKNGVYEIDTSTQNGWDTVLVDVYDKYNILFFSGANNYSPQTLNDDVSDEKYSELWITGYYLYNDNGYKNALWSGRYPTSILFPLIAGSIIYGGGPHNHMWITPTNGKRFNTFLAEYDYPYMYMGIKNEDRTEDVLWQSTESSTPSTINLAQSIFDYDEVCFFFVKYDGATVTSWYYTDEIAVNDIIQGYIDTNVSKYTIASNTSLTTVSEDGFRLYGVYGIKDTSMDKTTLFANSGSTNPSTIDLSDDCTNYDELTIIGHYIADGTICTSVYPVKIFGMRDDLNAVDRICVGTAQNATWMSITTPSSFTLDPPSGSGYTVILDKIVGVKRPVVSTAHELIDVEPLSVTTNNTYTAPTGKAYSTVTVNVPDRVQINPFPSGATTVSLYASESVTVTSSSIASDGTANINITETQSQTTGFEGMVIELNATANHLYFVEFDYQNTDAQYWEYPTYAIGWRIGNTADTSWTDWQSWPNNIVRDSSIHHYYGYIMATGDKIYLNFNLCGYSDSYTNTAQITNLKVYDYGIGLVANT